MFNEAGKLATSVVGPLVSQLADAIKTLLMEMKSTDTLKGNLEILYVAARHFVSKMGFYTAESIEQKFLEDRIAKLIKLCYDVEDKLVETNWKSRKRFFSGPELSELEEELKDILNQLEQLQNYLVGDISSQSNGLPELELVDGEVLRGREADRDAIIKELHSCLVGVSIVGMPGLGKTMLAFTILNDLELVATFHILKVVGFEPDSFVQTLQDQMNLCRERETFNGKQKGWLILIDNMVEPDVSSWDSCVQCITHKDVVGENVQVKIIITTRNHRVSNITSTTVYHLKRLSDGDCKQVIIDNLRPVNNARCEMVAGKLGAKCGGLPQVAKVLGAALRRHGESEWTDISNTELWNLEDFKKDVFPMLRSVYLDMDFDLLRCLAYFSLFSRNYCHPSDDLIQLWAAEGFIIDKSEDQTAALWLKRSDRCVQELLRRSVLELDGTKAGRPMYKLHEFNHKLSQSTASRFFVHLKEGQLHKPCPAVRHLSTSCAIGTIGSEFWKTLDKSRLRTFIAFFNGNSAPSDSKSLLHSAFYKLKRLRVLALKGIRVAELPSSMTKLKRLHYLDISYSDITKLPKKISKLSNLQFLRIKETLKLKDLPDDFQELSNLVWIDWEESDIKRFHLPSNIGNLSCLQNLPLFPVNDSGGFSIAALETMNALKGSIWITKLENVSTTEEAVAASLSSKVSLETIKLEWSDSNNNAHAEDILTALEPHNNLKKLIIVNGVFPSWMCDQGRQLETIHLKNCRSGNGNLPSLRELENLKSLIIEGVNDLQRVPDSFCGTPGGTFEMLESLKFENLAELEEWTGLGPTAMPRLSDLKTINCPKLISLPSLETLRSLVELQIEDCPELRSLPALPTSLKSLVVMNSDLVKARCQEGGEDWERVLGIPTVQLDNMVKKVPAQYQQQIHIGHDQGRPAIYDVAGRLFGYFIWR